jgi:hypothetical protein
LKATSRQETPSATPWRSILLQDSRTY